jgi:glycosyltransferase involved in cell wall biosynthesis
MSSQSAFTLFDSHKLSQVVPSHLTSKFQIQNEKESRLPARLLYASSARLGGSGLDAVARESVRVAIRGGILGRALVFDDRQHDFFDARIRSLRWHPVRLLASLVDRESYYGAKKRALDATAARELSSGPYDLVHGWSGECLRTLRVARERGIASVIEIPTWHRHKGKSKPTRLTMTERQRAALRGWAGWKNRLRVTRQEVLEEYELADLLLVLSEKAEETFLSAGIPKEKLFRHQRGVDVTRFTPAPARPELFRVLFVGSLIERKGVHHLLRAWAQLALKNAELVLAGTLHDEMRPWLAQFGGGNVRLVGFVRDIENLYRSAAVHVLPSTCEGSAKTAYEAAACGLPQITTRESGDVVIDEMNGLIVPADDPEALAAALARLHADRALCERLGAAGRQRIVENFTWAHFGHRLLDAYRRVMALREMRSIPAST